MEKDIIRTDGWELNLEKFRLNDPPDFNNGGDEPLAQSPEGSECPLSPESFCSGQASLLEDTKHPGSAFLQG